MRKETISIHGGFGFDPATKAVAPPIYQNVAYEFESADEAAALFNLEVSGYRYSRISNPTTDILEKRVAQLEGGAAALAVASGQAALAYAFLTLADRGGNIVAPPQLYGTTHTLLAHTLRRHGVVARFAASDRAEDIEPLVDDSTRAVFCESVGNPAGNVCDIEKLARLAHSRGVPLIVDNTVATPFLLRPIEFGADIVVHSLTKFMGGHGAAMGGAIVDSGRFDWASQASRFPMFCEPDESYHGLVYVDRFGQEAFVARARSVYQRTTGAVLAPMSAFLICWGLKRSPFAWSAIPKMRVRLRTFCVPTNASRGSTTPASPTAPITNSHASTWAGGRPLCLPLVSPAILKPLRRSTIRLSLSNDW